MRLRALALATSLVIAGSVSALAQTTTQVKITSGAIGTAVTSGDAAAGSYPAGTPNFYVSPYAGLINYVAGPPESGTSVSLNCVDYFHHVSIGNVWTANVTNLGAAATNNSLLANTRYGHAAGASNYPNILDLYKQAAWLTLQYDPNPGAAGSADKTRAIQSAIWALFTPWDGNASADAPWFNLTATSLNETQDWLNKASTYKNTVNLAEFSVLTDQNGTDPWGSSSKQEFLIHTTPEPGTVVLMLTGMIALFIVIRRRRTGASGFEAA